MFEFDPVVFLLLAGTAGLYIRAIRRLSKRGYRVPRSQQAMWWFGMSLATVGLLGPPAAFSDQLFWAHMTEHLLIADLAAPFLLAGLRTPVGLFVPPKEILVLVARNRPIRALGSFVTKPLVALPLSIVVLYGWHLGPAFTTATREPLFHALQHQSFLLASLIFWWPAIEPNRRPMPAQLWKIVYLLGGRMASILMGALFLASNRAFYSDLYAAGAKQHGLTALSDQQIGAGLMMLADVLIMMVVLIIFFTKAASQGAREDQQADELRLKPST